MARYELKAGPKHSNALDVFALEGLDELESALRELVAQGPVALELSLHPAPAPPFTVPEAFAELVALSEVPLAPDAIVRCTFASEKAVSAASRHLPSADRPAAALSLGRLLVDVELGDLTRTRADAIVNASNASLVLGGGVSGAIRRAVADPDGLQAAMRAHAPIAPGSVATTGSFGLACAPTIVHAATVSGDADDVRRALRNIFAACELHGLRSVALPALGCGTGGLALATFARIAREELEAHAPRAEHLERVKIVLHDAEAYAEVAPAFR